MNQNTFPIKKMISDAAFAVALTTIFLAARRKSYKSAVNITKNSIYATS